MVSKVTYTDITNKQTNGESGAALVNDTKRAINEVIDLVGDIDLGGVGGSTLPVFQPRQLGDGVKTTFNTPATGTQDAKAQHFDVYLNYVYQRPELDFSIDGATGDLTFLDNVLPYAPNLNDTVDIKYIKPYTFDTSSDTPVEGTGTGVTKSLGDWFGGAGPAKVTATGTSASRSLADRFGDTVRVSNFTGCDLSDPYNDDTNAMKAALATGKHVYIDDGTLTISDELFTVNPSQQIIGAGRLNIKGKALIGVGTRVLVPLGTTIPKTQKTRRLARTSAADPDDAPISCVFTLMGRGNVVRDLSIELECDYTDTSHTNLGADCDVAIFNNCKQDVEIHDVNILGYFRKAGVYLDVTASNNVPDRITGTLDSDRTTGSDRIKINHVEIDGSWKDIFLAGPILNGAGTYYDDVTGLVSDARGGSGASDLLIEGNNYLHGRNHHSSRRGYDPVMNPDAEDIDAMTGSIVIDSRRGSASQGRTRRIHIKDTRITTFEAARIFTGRAYEVYIEWLHTEPGSTSNTRYDTAGNVISVSDTVNVTYGPIACQTPTDSLSGTDHVYAWQVWGTGIVGAWTTALVPNFDHTRRFVNPQFDVEFDEDVTAGGEVVAGGKVTAGTSLNGTTLKLTTQDTSFTPVLGFITAPTYTTQVGKYTEIAGMVFVDILLTWSGLDIADTSSFNIQGLPVLKDNQSGFLTKIDVLASTGITNPESLYFDDNGSASQVALYDSATGAPIAYNSGRVLASGTLALTLQYRS